MHSDPKHQASLQSLLQLPPEEIRRRITIGKYRDPDYIATEVLVSLVRMRFGQDSGLLDPVVATLYGRLMTLIEQYFRKNSQWYGVVASNSETLAEATSTAWVNLNSDKKPVSFAEVRILPWVEAQAEEYLQQQLAMKNQMPSYDATSAVDEDGNEVSYEQRFALEDDDAPEELYERKVLSENLLDLLMSLETKVRYAVYYRLLCEFDWEKVAELMHVTKPTARKYYNIGIESLKGATNG